MSLYDSFDDPNCYPGTSVLKNLVNLRTQEALTEFETAITSQRADEGLPEGNLDTQHYRALHYHLYQDIYAWAGAYRAVRTSKGGNMFCYPENIAAQMDARFKQLADTDHFRGLDADAFAAKSANFLAELNAIHPFREGNGRTQLLFLKLVANAAGHHIDFTKLDPPAMLDAMIASFHGNETLLATQIRRLIQG